jgi:membrane-associated phospholipid phosphatase
LTWGPNDHLSLPSGHATVAFALSSVIAGLYPRRWWQIFWYALAVITAVSRMYHDQHWLSDVLFSALLGTAVGVWLVNQHLQRTPGDIHVE